MARINHPASVEVVTAGWTEDTYPRATADEFEADTLTITSLDTAAEVAVYRPGTWRSYVVADERGYPLFAGTSRMETARLQAERTPKE